MIWRHCENWTRRSFPEKWENAQVEERGDSSRNVAKKNNKKIVFHWIKFLLHFRRETTISGDRGKES